MTKKEINKIKNRVKINKSKKKQKEVINNITKKFLELQVKYNDGRSLGISKKWEIIKNNPKMLKEYRKHIPLNKNYQELTKKEWIDKYVNPEKIQTNVSEFITKYKLGTKTFLNGLNKYVFMNILDLECKTFPLNLNASLLSKIKILSEFSGVMSGVFMDYLTRIIISIINKEKFYDSRANKFPKIAKINNWKGDFLIYYNGRSSIATLEQVNNLYFVEDHCFLFKSRKKLVKIVESIKTIKDIEDRLEDIFVYSNFHNEDFFGMDVENIDLAIGYGFIKNFKGEIKNLYKLWEKKLIGAKVIKTNPPLGSGNIPQADADLIIDNTIIDFKVMKVKPAWKSKVQLFLYAYLYENFNKKIDTLKVISYYDNTLYSLDVKDIKGKFYKIDILFKETQKELTKQINF